DMAHIAGLVAGGVHPSPLPHALVTTLTTHKTLRGPRGGMILADSDIIKKVNSAVFPGGQGGPLMHVIAAKAVALKEAAQPEFASYARSTVENAQALAEALAAGGLRIISGGTDNHLLLVDVDSAGLSGREAEDRLHAVDITCNKNLIPFDQRPPMEASGVRLGTAAITARGLGVAEVTQLGALIVEMLREEQTEARCERVRGAVAELANAFPIYA
ncbi:MAG: serine hydroxymethyltransferase, partial [Planctomycetota bacterium]|nr:serine hydroxymethyltransferase [Planctomycetota bacterium]